MKRLFIAGLILSLLLSLFANEEVSVEELRQLVQEEQKHLTDLLDEITFLTNLLEKKFIIKAHLQEGEIAKIKALFMKDQKEIDLLYEQLQGKKMLAFNNQLKALYGDIEVIEPFLLFNDARGFYLESQYEKSQKKLEDIIDYHSNFELLDEAILLLQEIYFKLGLHKEFVSLYVRASNKNTEIQKYWLGHSHYNIGNYQEAEKIFTSLLDNKNFGFRADAMLALISNYTQGTEYAIREFNQLLKSYPPATEHYHFGILSLARLYADIDEIDIALEYYDLYSKHYPGEIPDELLFEIGLMNKNHGKYLKAISYFNKILKKPIKSEYYASAKILATISQKQSGQFGEIETGLNEIISLNDILLETLNAKYGLMDKYRELTQNLEEYKDNPARSETIQTQIEQVEQMLFNTNKTVENLYSGDDVTTLAAISIMEEEYMYYTETIEMMNSVVELAKTTPNKRIPKNIDRSIEAGDYDILNLTMIGFLGHLPQNKFWH
jgi:tetratricopeptide (TPR) repeat protein